MEDRADPFPGFAAAAEALTPEGPPRVWSLIVTVFGDNAGEAGFEIGAGPLARILEPAGVTGAAMRVALHRLKRDGWIEARRAGRSAIYRLAPGRFTEIRAAALRIYATGPAPADWHVALSGPDAAPAPADRTEEIQIAPRLSLRPGTPGSDADSLALAPVGVVPDWLRARVCPTELLDAYRALHDGLATAADLTDPPPPPGRAETIALRLLVVHAWRRVLLRHPPLPDALFPADWPGPECRALVATLLDRLPRPTPEEIAAL